MSIVGRSSSRQSGIFAGSRATRNWVQARNDLTEESIDQPVNYRVERTNGGTNMGDGRGGGGKRRSLQRSIEELKWDLWIAVPAIGLGLFGLVMVHSASVGLKGSDRFLISQLAALLIGILAMIIIQRIDYHNFTNPLFAYGLLLGCLLLLGLVLFGEQINDSNRWIRLRGLSIQPSEFAKLTLAIFLAWFLKHREEEGRLANFWLVVIPAGVVLGLLSALILKEPDLGTTLILAAMFVAVLFAAGVPTRHLLICAPPLLLVVVVEIIRKPYRVERILSYFNPEQDPLGKGYHILQSLKAIGRGGVNGLGIGQSWYKTGWLPEPNSDFIFPVVAEELGLIGAGTLILTIGFLVWRGLLASLGAPDTAGRLLAVGLTVWIGCQSLLNISVVLNLLPTKGITLPFISAGGTSLVAVMIAVGILLNISAQGDVRIKQRN
ncbi:MAG: putative lipid II flippase FtsW [Acidobacteria bacterium]|nr:putative lipid II flippase FtsW [Acidobacteriota bacterium]